MTTYSVHVYFRDNKTKKIYPYQEKKIAMGFIGGVVNQETVKRIELYELPRRGMPKKIKTWEL